MPDTTHFGFKTVALEEKSRKVAAVFDSVATRYDVMNDVMSFGLHRLWKRCAIALCQFRPGQQVLDLAAGTGDLAEKISPQIGDQGCVTLADINRNMLMVGRDRLLDRGIFSNVQWVQTDAERLAFPDHYFDRVVMGFGLRNVTQPSRALASIYRCLKPGGLLVILEFSKPAMKSLSALYDAYSFHVIPAVGKLIAKDAASYQYLVESIRKHPDQHQLLAMMRATGYEHCDYCNLTGGIVALHRGWKC